MSKAMDRIDEAGPAVLDVLARICKSNGEAVVTLCRVLSCLRIGKIDADSLREGLELAIREVDDMAEPYGGPDKFVELMEESREGGVN